NPNCALPGEAVARKGGGGSMAWTGESGQERGNCVPRRVIALSAFSTVLLAIHLAAAPAAAQQEAPPPAVIAQTVEIESAGEHAKFSGVVEAIDKVDILARVEGFIQAIEFEGG